MCVMCTDARANNDAQGGKQKILMNPNGALFFLSRVFDRHKLSLREMSSVGSFNLNVELRPTPARRDEFLACIRNNQRNTLDKAKEPDCLAYQWGESTSDPNVFHFTEKYKDEAAFKHHQAQPRFAEWEKYAWASRSAGALAHGPPDRCSRHAGTLNPRTHSCSLRWCSSG